MYIHTIFCKKISKYNFKNNRQQCPDILSTIYQNLSISISESNTYALNLKVIWRPSLVIFQEAMTTSLTLRCHILGPSI